MFTARPRSVRDFLNDSSIKALTCANEARTGMRGDPRAAGGARICSAVLADLRDAFDLQAPWLKDRDQVEYLLTAASAALAPGVPFRLDVPPDELAQVLAELVEEYEEEAQALRERAAADRRGPEGGDDGDGEDEEDGDAGGEGAGV